MEYNRPEPEGGLYSIIPRLPWYNCGIYTIVFFTITNVFSHFNDQRVILRRNNGLY